jgi:hypothetical protein
VEVEEQFNSVGMEVEVQYGVVIRCRGGDGGTSIGSV